MNLQQLGLWLRKYALHLVFIGVEGWLLYRLATKGHLFPFSQKDQEWLKVMGPYVTPIAGLIGGAVALVTYNRSHAQKQEHFDRQALDTQFSDTLDRFSSDKPVMRAHAAIRLGEIAETLRPGAFKKYTLDSHPFFPRAASQLAAALLLEEDPAVSEEVVKALTRMAKFGGQDKQALLHLLLQELADANRTAKKSFIQALASCLSVPADGDDDTNKWTELARYAPFSDNDAVVISCLQGLEATPEYRAYLPQNELKRELRTEALNHNETKLALNASADRLIAARDILAVALKQFHKSTPSPIPLSACFLVGANLQEANLQEADLRGANLRGANLLGTDLQWANLQGAQLCEAVLEEADLRGADLWGVDLQGAQLQGAKLQGAQLQRARLRRANLQRARLQGAQLQRADLQGANLWGVDLQGVDLQGAQLQRADLRGANLQGANLQEAQLQGADLQRAVLEETISGVTHLADFENTNWQEAHLGETERAWLQENFPLSQPEPSEQSAATTPTVTKPTEETPQEVQLGGDAFQEHRP